jgi:excisionase family DNA binding protein
MSSHPAAPALAQDEAYEPYYTVPEVAARLKVDPRTVYELISSGQLRAVRISRQPGSDRTKAARRIRGADLAEYEQRLRDEG